MAQPTFALQAPLVSSGIEIGPVTPDIFRRTLGAPAREAAARILGATATASALIDSNFTQVFREHQPPRGAASFSDTLPQYEIWARKIVRKWDPKHWVSGLLMNTVYTTHIRFKVIVTEAMEHEALGWRDRMALPSPITKSHETEASMNQFACGMSITREEWTSAAMAGNGGNQNIYNQIDVKHAAVISALCRAIEADARAKLVANIPSIESMLVYLDTRSMSAGQIDTVEQHRRQRSYMAARTAMAAKSRARCIHQFAGECQRIFGQLHGQAPSRIVVIVPQRVFMLVSAMLPQQQPIERQIDVPSVVNLGADYALDTNIKLRGVELPGCDVDLYSYSCVKPDLDSSPAWVKTIRFGGFVRMAYRADGNYVSAGERNVLIADANGNDNAAVLSILDAITHCGIWRENGYCPVLLQDVNPNAADHTNPDMVNYEVFIDPSKAGVFGGAHNGNSALYLTQPVKVLTAIINNLRAVLKHQYGSQADAWLSDNGTDARFRDAVRGILFPPNTPTGTLGDPPGSLGNGRWGWRTPTAENANVFQEVNIDNNHFYKVVWPQLAASGVNQYLIWAWTNAPMCATTFEHQITFGLFPPLSFVVLNGRRAVRGYTAIAAVADPATGRANIATRVTLGGWFDVMHSTMDANLSIRYIASSGVVPHVDGQALQSPTFDIEFLRPPGSVWMQPSDYSVYESEVPDVGDIFALVCGVGGTFSRALDSSEFNFLHKSYGVDGIAGGPMRDLYGVAVTPVLNQSWEYDMQERATMVPDADQRSAIVFQQMYSREYAYNRATGREELVETATKDVVFGVAGSPDGLNQMLEPAPLSFAVA